MFKFLKEKIKGALSVFSEKVEETVKEDKVETPKEETKQIVEDKKEFKEPQKNIVEEKKELKIEVSEKTIVTQKKEERQVEIKKEDLKIKKEKEPEVEVKKEERKQEIKKDKAEIKKEEIKKENKIHKEELEKVEEQKPEKKGFFAKIAEKITTTKISEEKFDECFWNLELALLESNVAVEVIEKIKKDLKKELTEKQISRSHIEETVLESLKKSLSELFIEEKIDLIELSKKKKPLVICFIGINGSGKTTTLAKMTKYFQNKKLSVVMAAADTFRAAAIDQLQIHADKLGVKLIKHDYGADAAAVAFDAIKHAEAAKKDIVLIDTAGRLHSNHNLVEEMKKIIKIAKPDLKIFVGESITGNDCIEQAQKFNDAVNLDGIILSKTDIDEKGGAAISVSYVTKKPILFIGTGQEYSDLEEFSKEKILKNLGF